MTWLIPLLENVFKALKTGSFVVTWFLLLLLRQVSLYSPDWPETCTDLPASASHVLKIGFRGI